MARTKNNQRSANRVAVDVGATGTTPISKRMVAVLVISVVAAVWAVAMMTAPGRVAYYFFFIYCEYYMGVLALVALSIAVMVGLLSTDRLVLSIKMRVMLQSVHRTMGVIAVISLAVHLWTKLAESHIRVIDILIPFLAPTNTMYVGLGTISSYLLIFVTWTGIARARFIGRGKPWMWRALHSVAYLLWPIALFHGLGAGRLGKPFVFVGYVLCVLLVIIGLAVRLAVSLNRRKDFSSTMGTAGATNIAAVGSMVPTAAVAKKGRGRGEERPAETLGPVAVLDTWKPAAAPVTAPPVQEPPRRRPMPDEEPMPAPRQRRPRDEEFDERPAPRGRRRADDDYGYDDEPRRPRRDDLESTSTRMRRDELESTSARMRRDDLESTSTRMRRDDLESTSARMRRDDLESTSTRMRRVEMTGYDEPTQQWQQEEPRGRRQAPPMMDEPRGRRYADDDAPRGRRHADDEYDDVPRQRAPRYGRDEVDAPRARRDRGADEYDSADSGRHSRSDFVDFDDEDPNYMDPDETPTLIDMASRRARRAQQGVPQQETMRGQAGRGVRRGGRARSNDEVADDAYWSQLRGEAQ